MVCFVLFLALAGLVSAEGAELTECIVQDGPSFTIQNTDILPHTYALSLKGKYLMLSESQITVPAGSSYIVSTTAAVPCGKTGSYKGTLTFVDDLGQRNALSTQYNVVKTANIALIPKDYAKQITPCRTALYSYDIRNSGEFTETYKVLFDPSFAPFTNVSFSEISLNPGDTGHLTFAVTPACDLYGNFTVPFEVRSVASKLIAKTEAILLIDQAYDFTVEFGQAQYSVAENETISFVATDVGEAYDLCTQGAYTIPLRIENIAKVPNSYALRVSGMNLDVLEESFSLNESETKDILLSIPRQAAGTGEISVEVLTSIGDMAFTANRSVKITNCFEPLLTSESGKQTEVVDYGQGKIPFILKNTGSETTTYRISVEGSEFITISPSTATLAADAEEKVHILTRPQEEDSRGNYPIIIFVVPDNTNAEYSHDFTVKLVTMNAFDTFYYSYIAPYMTYMVVAILILVIFGVLAMMLPSKGRKKAKSAKPASKTVTGVKPWFKKLVLIVVLIIVFAIVYALLYYLIPAALWNPYRWLISIGLFAVLLLLIIFILILKPKGRTKSKKVQPASNPKEEKKVVEQKVASKKPAKKAKKSKPLPKSFWAWIIALGLILIIVAVAVIFIDYIKALVLFVAPVVWQFCKDYWPYIVGAIVGVLLIVLIIMLLVWHKKRTVFFTKLTSKKETFDLRSYPFALGELFVSLNKTFENSSVTVKKIAEPTFLKASNAVYQYFSVDFDGLDEEDVSSVTMRFSVPKKWFKKHNVKPSSIQLKRYDTKWRNVPTTMVVEDAHNVYFEAQAGKCSFFAIAGTADKPKKAPPLVVERRTAKKSPWGALLAVILLILLILVIWLLLAQFGSSVLGFIVAYYVPILILIVVLIVLAFIVLQVVKKPKKKRKKERKEKGSWGWVWLVLIAIIVLLFLFWPRGAVLSPAVNESEEVIQPEIDEELFNETEALENEIEELEDIDIPDEVIEEEIIEDSVVVPEEEVVEPIEEETIEEEEVVEEEIQDPVVEESDEETHEEETTEDVEEVPEEIVEPVLEEPSESEEITDEEVEVESPEEEPSEVVEEPVEEVTEETFEEASVEEETHVTIIDAGEDVEVEGIAPQTWKGGRHTLDLSDYFSDPDNDTLSYYHTAPRHIGVTFEGDVAVLMPEVGWTGSEYIIFTADDGKGGTVDSNLIKLTVTEGTTEEEAEVHADDDHSEGTGMSLQTAIVLALAMILVIALGIIGAQSLAKK